MPQPRSVLIVGLGDLGLRIALRLAMGPEPLRLRLAGRDLPRVRARAALVVGCSPSADVRFLPLDALDGEAVRAALVAQSPDVLIQCASMHSPWLLHGRRDPVALRLRAAGFASELSAQLPVAHSVFAAARAVGYDGLRINCSYPDVVDPVLAAAGLAPDFGIGNAGMIHMLAEAALRARGIASRVHTLAHHSHVTMVATGRFPADAERAPVSAQNAPSDVAMSAAAPVFFLDGRPQTPARVFSGAGNIPLGSDRNLNELTAAHAVSMLRAYLGWSPPLRTAAPGPLGRAGGWPVTVVAGELELDLPSDVGEDAIVAFNAEAARLDGIERIDGDGRVHFTRALRDALGPDLRALAEPLRLTEAPTRYARLRAALDAGAADVEVA